MTTTTVLQEEVQTFYDHKVEFLREHENKFVLIKNSRVIGFFDRREDAETLALDRFGPVAFLIKQILRVEPALYCPYDLGPGIDVIIRS